MTEKLELRYNDLQASYQDLEEHKNELVSMKDQQITKYKNNIVKLEIDNENIKETLECKQIEINGLIRQCTESNRKKAECEAIQESLEKEIEEIKINWKTIDLTDFQNKTQMDKEKIQKYIFINKMCDTISQQKITYLEEALKNSEAQFEVASQRLKNEQQLNKQSGWFSFGRLFNKSPNEKQQSSNLEFERNSLTDNQNNYTKMLTVYNREKEMLQTRIKELEICLQQNGGDDNIEIKKEYKDKIKILEKELKRKENECIALETSIDKLKKELKIKEEETNEIEVLKKENLKIKKLQAAVRSKAEILDNSKIELETKNKEIESLERKLNGQTVLFDELYAKKLNLEDYIKNLEDNLNRTQPPSRASIFDHYEPIAESILENNSFGQSSPVFESNEKRVRCGNCDQMIPQSQIEGHFTICIENGE